MAYDHHDRSTKHRSPLVARLLMLWERPAYRYLVVGGSVYVLELAIIVLAKHLGSGDVVAVAISFWIGLMVSFGLQKMITFGDRRLHRRVLSYQLLAVLALVLWNFGFTLVVTDLLSHSVPAVVCRTLALAITTVWNFYLYKTHIFQTT